MIILRIIIFLLLYFQIYFFQNIVNILSGCLQSNINYIQLVKQHLDIYNYHNYRNCIFVFFFQFNKILRNSYCH